MDDLFDDDLDTVANEYGINQNWRKWDEVIGKVEQIAYWLEKNGNYMGLDWEYQDLYIAVMAEGARSN